MLDRQTASLQQVAGAAIVAGAQVEIPDFESQRDEFDAALNAEPAPETAGQRRMRELGVA